MSKHRTPSEKSKYYLPKETFLTVIHYCKQYPLWIAELALHTDALGGIDYNKERVQASGDGDSTSNIAIKRAAVSKKKDLVDSVAREVAGNYDKWIILGTCYDLPYYQLVHRGIPFGKDLYYKLRRAFYFELAKRI